MAFILVEGGAAATGNTAISVAIATVNLGFTPTTMILDFDGTFTLPPITFKPLIPDFRLPDTVSDADSLTLNVRLSDGISTTDLTTTFIFRTSKENYFPYSELTQFIANSYPDHSPIRNLKDSVGQKIINIFAEQIEYTEKAALTNEEGLSLLRHSEDMPDILLGLDIPNLFGQSILSHSSNVLYNGGFLMADRDHAYGWNHKGDFSFDTVDPLIGFRSIELDPDLNEISILGQVLRDVSFSTELTLNIAYRPTGAGVASKDNYLHLWLFSVDGTATYLTQALSTATSDWVLASVTQLISTTISHIVVAVSVESDGSETVTTDVGYLTLRMADANNPSWGANIADIPRHFRVLSNSSIDPSPSGMILADNEEDFWHDAVPTRLSSISLILPPTCTDDTIYTDTFLVTVVSDGDTVFTLPNEVLFPEQANVHIGQTTFTLGVDYTIVGDQLTWSGILLEAGDTITVVYKRCEVIPDDATAVPALAADEVLTVPAGPPVFTLAAPIPAGGTAVIFYKGVFHQRNLAWTSSGTALTWLGPPDPALGDKMYLIYDVSTLAEYTVFDETKAPYYRYDRFRDRYVAEYFFDRVNNSIKKRLVSIPGDVLAEYTEVAKVVDIVDYITETMPAIYGFDVFHSKIFSIIRDSDGYKLLVLNRATPHPEPDYLEVEWIQDLPVPDDILIIGCRFIDADQQRLHIFTPDAQYQVRLHYDYAAFARNAGKIYFREQPANGAIIQPMFDPAQQFAQTRE